MSEYVDLESELGTVILRVSDNTGWLYLYDDDASITLSQEQAKALVPYLQTFAETGKIKQEGGE